MMTRPGWKSTAAYGGLLAAAFLAAVLASLQPQLGEGLDHWAYDFMFRSYEPPAWQTQSVILAIDEPTLQAYGGVERLRGPLASALRSLAAVRPKAIAIDVTLADPGIDPDADARLAAALAATPRVVLASDMGSGEGWEDPLPQFRAGGAALGQVHTEPDADGITRAIALEKRLGTVRRWALSLEAFRLSRGAARILESPRIFRWETPSSRFPGKRPTAPATATTAASCASATSPPTGPSPFPAFLSRSWSTILAGAPMRGQSGLRRLDRRHRAARPLADPGCPVRADSGSRNQRQRLRDHGAGIVPHRRSLPGWCCSAWRWWRLPVWRSAICPAGGPMPAAGHSGAGRRRALRPLYPPPGAAVLDAGLRRLRSAPWRPPVTITWWCAATWRVEHAARTRYQQAMQFVTHEMRTPLSAIQGSSELMSRYALTEEKRKQIAQLINSESKRLARMVEVFLSVERLSAGQMELKREAHRRRSRWWRSAWRASGRWPSAKHIAVTLEPVADELTDLRRPRADGVRLLQSTYQRHQVFAAAHRGHRIRLERRTASCASPSKIRASAWTRRK